MRDMLAKTTRMTTEQIGASFLLMMDYWRNGANAEMTIILLPALHVYQLVNQKP